MGLRGWSELVVGEDVWPDGVDRIGRLGDDPEALAGVVDDGDDFVGDGGDGPVFAQEVEGVIGVESALDIEGQVQVQQRHGRHGPVAVVLCLQGLFPGGVGVNWVVRLTWCWLNQAIWVWRRALAGA